MEQEIKITINSVEQFNKFINHFEQKPEPEVQTNTYLKNEYLTENKIALRIRDSNNELILTTKQKSKHVNGYFVCEETNTPIERVSVEEFIKNNGNENYKNLEVYAIIKTKRHHRDLNQFHLECDDVVVEHPQQISFCEIECETTDPETCKEQLLQLFAQLEITDFEYSKTTKLGRAMNK
ncbi:CYTH-like_domain-containing protein [Hexamita inflata]|uniref:CYTH-like domain-containing protein n=1 Tax=Hexamita inflata TaxID=28002 RepID=A0AA86RDR3_9EUKA|nr:CYTH-like domain-containing protein [Hexamita inflata]